MAKHGNPCHTREMSIHKGRHDTYYTYYGPAGEPPLLQQPVANFSNHRIQHTHGVLFLVVVFIVNIDDLPFDDLEGKAPVGRYAKTPDFFAVAGQLMGFPQRQISELAGIPHILQEGQNRSKFHHSVCGQGF